MKQDSQPEIDWLEPGLSHSPGCSAHRLNAKHGSEACDCGLDEARAALSALLSLKEGGGLASCTDSAASVASQPDCSAVQSFAGPEAVAMAAVAAIDGDGAWDAYAPDERRRIANRIGDAMRGEL